MVSGRCTTIPRAFSYILPVQSLVTGAVVYGTVYTFPAPFTIRSIAFILAVVATGLQFFLGLYCCFLGAKSGIYHRFIIPIWLLVLAAIWVGPLYYLTLALESELALRIVLGDNFKNVYSDPEARMAWRAVGVAGSAVNCFIDLILLAVFIYVGLHQPKSVGFNPNPASAPPTSYAQHPHMTYGPTTTVAAARATTFPPTSPATFSPVQVDLNLQQQQQQFHHHHAVAVHHHPSPPALSSSPPMSSVPQYHQQQAPLTAAHIAPSPSPGASSDGKHQSAVTVTTTTMSSSYDPQNRIDLLRRVLSLQAPADGHWDWSPELQDILRLCGRDLTDTSASAVTMAACTLCIDICQYVWAAQREGREHTALTAAEMMTLQGMNWDLGWAKSCTDRAGMWMQGFR